MARLRSGAGRERRCRCVDCPILQNEAHSKCAGGKVGQSTSGSAAANVFANGPLM